MAAKVKTTSPSIARSPSSNAKTELRAVLDEVQEGGVQQRSRTIAEVLQGSEPMGDPSRVLGLGRVDVS